MSINLAAACLDSGSFDAFVRTELGGRIMRTFTETYSADPFTKDAKGVVKFYRNRDDAGRFTSFCHGATVNSLCGKPFNRKNSATPSLIALAELCKGNGREVCKRGSAATDVAAVVELWWIENGFGYLIPTRAEKVSTSKVGQAIRTTVSEADLFA